MTSSDQSTGTGVRAQLVCMSCEAKGSIMFPTPGKPESRCWKCRAALDKELR